MSILRFKDDNGNIIDIPALRGKSAYQYAQEGGFKGTEAEFMERIAAEWATKEELDTKVSLYIGSDDIPEGYDLKIDPNGAADDLISRFEFNQLGEEVNDLKNIDAVLSARMDTFTKLDEGSTTGDAELADARVDFNGKTWDNVGDHVRGVSSQLSGQIDEIVIRTKSENMYDGQYVNGYLKSTSTATSTPTEASGWYTSNAIEVEPNEQYDYVNQLTKAYLNSQQVKYSYWYDTDGNNIGLADLGATVTAPPNAKFIRICASTWLNGTQSGFYKHSYVESTDVPLADYQEETININNDKITYDETLEKSGMGADSKIVGDNFKLLKQGIQNLLVENIPENPIQNICENVGLISVFTEVGVIGDSMSSGACYYANGNSSRGAMLYEYSWGQFLARATGNTYHNFSSGGLTTKTWLESEYATQCFDGNHLCKAYFVALGVNDKNQSATIGTSADIDMNNYNNNVDSFYGNYGKIIQKIKEVQPKAKIFILTAPSNSVENNGYNNAIREIATLFTNVYLVDLYTYGHKYFYSEYVQNYERYGHYNAIVYRLFAYIIANYVDWIMKKYQTEFAKVEFIGTDWD